MPNFTDYYQPCEPGKGLLVNGQYWRTRFGKETLQMMVSDGVFSMYDEPALVESDEACVCNECMEKDRAIDDLNEKLADSLSIAKDGGNLLGRISTLLQEVAENHEELEESLQ